MTTANHFEVFCDAGEVWIAQGRADSDAQDLIRLHPDQVPMLCKWLKQAANAPSKATTEQGLVDVTTQK